MTSLAERSCLTLKRYKAAPSQNIVHVHHGHHRLDHLNTANKQAQNKTSIHTEQNYPDYNLDSDLD